MDKDEVKQDDNSFFNILGLYVVRWIKVLYLLFLVLFGLIFIAFMASEMMPEMMHNMLFFKSAVTVVFLLFLIIAIVYSGIFIHMVILSIKTENQHKKRDIIICIVCAVVGISIGINVYKELYKEGLYAYDVWFNGMQIEEISDYEVHAYAYSDDENEYIEVFDEDQISESEDSYCELIFKDKEYSIDPEDYITIINDEDGKIKIGYYKIIGRILSIEQE